MTIAVCPGSFDPVTNGHLDIIERASQIFERVVVGVSQNPGKKPLFTVEERCELLAQVVRYLPNVSVDPLQGLLVDFASKHGAQVIVKGLRAISDFEYEFQMALMNKRMNPAIETMFMMTRHEYSFLSSSSVKEIVLLGGNPQGLVPAEVETALNQKLRGERL